MLKIESNKYNNCVFSEGHLYAFTGLLKHEDITHKILFTKRVWRNVKGGNPAIQAGNTIVGAILGGLIGAIIGSKLNRKKVSACYDVTLRYGYTFTIITDIPKLLDLLEYYKKGR